MGEVLQFPAPRVPDCRICMLSMSAEHTYCFAFDEFIDNERSAAQDCELYQEDADKS